jgi:hypothetical protein
VGFIILFVWLKRILVSITLPPFFLIRNIVVYPPPSCVCHVCNQSWVKYR